MKRSSRNSALQKSEELKPQLILKSDTRNAIDHDTIYPALLFCDGLSAMRVYPLHYFSCYNNGYGNDTGTICTRFNRSHKYFPHTTRFIADGIYVFKMHTRTTAGINKNPVQAVYIFLFSFIYICMYVYVYIYNFLPIYSICMSLLCKKSKINIWRTIIFETTSIINTKSTELKVVIFIWDFSRNVGDWQTKVNNLCTNSNLWHVWV